MVEAKNLRIVVVDDQKTMRALVRHTLLALGCHKVIECNDGVEALAQLIEHPADLVISDLNMPRLDGLGLLRMVRKQSGIETTPFIMLTNRGELTTVREAKALGVNNYIVKPFNLATMKRKIEAVVGPLE
jgi:two-component system chemotaxis response regulator CheY